MESQRSVFGPRLPSHLYHQMRKQALGVHGGARHTWNDVNTKVADDREGEGVAFTAAEVKPNLNVRHHFLPFFTRNTW